jgi:hypothetical protein
MSSKSGFQVMSDLRLSRLVDLNVETFTGSHADIGGGSVPNSTAHSLSNVCYLPLNLCLASHAISQITLRWMVREVTSSQCGIIFDRRALDQLKIQKDILGSPMRAGVREKALDGEDLTAPIFDQLRPRRGISAWWLTEILPSLDEWQTKSGEWVKRWR